MKEKLLALFQGEVTLRKRELWMIGGFFLFAGIVYGLLKAPWTHGVTIGSHNGNGNGNCGDDDCDCDCDCDEDCDCDCDDDDEDCCDHK